MVFGGTSVLLKNYRFGFDIFGMAAFLVIMLPNFIWFASPAPNDILRAESVTPVADAVASVSQVLMAFALCAVINKEWGRLRLSGLLVAAVLCCVLYYAGWAVYYLGCASDLVILVLATAPCLSFALYALDRKNIPALIPTAVFTVCHLIFALANFII